MNLVEKYYQLQASTIDKIEFMNGLPSLAFRVYLANVFWMAGNSKWNPFDSESSLQPTIDWFGNADWGLGLPFPELLGSLAWATEYFGAILLLIGLATRWISIPLIATMIVAIFTVHIDNGWSAIASSSDGEIASRIGAVRSILQEHGNYDWLTEKGVLVILQNGIEFAFTYLIMLISLLFVGGGRFVSVDYFLNRHFSKK
ncbi:MAG: AraC family transcriptional regulator [Gammaproteobacteria bacterium]|nr:MAG: AraC family transcriptional regulator [Gammaproteobacteria bacterium]